MNPPTTRQLEILAFIRDHMIAEGMPPTIAEIGSHFGFSSTNGVHEQLRSLEKKGLLERTPHKSRNWRPTIVSLGDIGLAHPGNDAAMCTPTITTADAIAVGQTLRALALQAPAGAADPLARVGRQLLSAGMLAKAGAQ